MGLLTVSQNIKDFVKINQAGFNKLNDYKIDTANDGIVNNKTDTNNAIDNKSIKDA